MRSAVRHNHKDPCPIHCVRDPYRMNFVLLALLSSPPRLHPTYVHAMNNLGNILKEREELAEAELLLSRAVAIQ